jgi:uncharacterized protein (TIGR03000 family)
MYSVVLMVAVAGGGDVPAGLFSHGCGGCYSSCACSGYGCDGCYGCSGCSGYGCSGCFGCSGYGCHGCSGYSSCHGCHGGHKGFLGGMFKRHGCHGCGGCHGCHGCHGCSGSYGCHGCSGYACGGCGGCYGSGYACGGCGGCGGGYGYGCAGYACNGCAGGVVAPAMPAVEGKKAIEEKKDDKKVEDKNDKKDDGDASAQAAPATIVVSLPADARLTIDGTATRSTSSRRVFISPKLAPGMEYRYTLRAEYTRAGEPVVVTREVRVRAGAEARVTLAENGLAGVASR